LREEVARIRGDPPDLLVAIGDPVVAPLVADGQGELLRPAAADGPWDVHVTLQGDAEDVLYSKRLQVRLRFDKEWPREPPVVHFRGLLTHPLLDDERGPPESFYKHLRQPGGELRLLDVALAARRFFADPLRALGLADVAGKEGWVRRVEAALQAARRANAQRLDVMQRYALQARHPVLFCPDEPLRPEWFAPGFRAASSSSSPDWRALLAEHQPGQVYSLPLFTEAFCDVLLEEIFGFYASGLPAARPNSMNNYGVILSDIGLEWFVDKLQALLQPLGEALFPVVGSAWDGHHCFVVRYRQGEDLGLDMHTDDSDVTFNVCLGLDFTGAGLQFCGEMGAPDHRRRSFAYQHVKGSCVMHLGRKRHGADDIASGERLNLILWNHSSAYRRSREFRQPDYSREAGPPDPACVSYTHDRDYGVFREYPEAYRHFRGRGWCPPPRAEYEGFVADSGLLRRLAGSRL